MLCHKNGWRETSVSSRGHPYVLLHNSPLQLVGYASTVISHRSVGRPRGLGSSGWFFCWQVRCWHTLLLRWLEPACPDGLPTWLLSTRQTQVLHLHQMLSSSQLPHLALKSSLRPANVSLPRTCTL